MKKITLQFKDILQLVEYLEFTDTHQSMVDYEKTTLTCELSDADIELAIYGYGAEVVEKQ